MERDEKAFTPDRRSLSTRRVIVEWLSDDLSKPATILPMGGSAEEDERIEKFVTERLGAALQE